MAGEPEVVVGAEGQERLATGGDFDSRRTREIGENSPPALELQGSKLGF
jgi:hypothetical protein